MEDSSLEEDQVGRHYLSSSRSLCDFHFAAQNHLYHCTGNRTFSFQSDDSRCHSVRERRVVTVDSPLVDEKKALMEAKLAADRDVPQVRYDS